MDPHVMKKGYNLWKTFSLVLALQKFPFIELTQIYSYLTIIIENFKVITHKSIIHKMKWSSKKLIPFSSLVNPSQKERFTSHGIIMVFILYNALKLALLYWLVTIQYRWTLSPAERWSLGQYPPWPPFPPSQTLSYLHISIWDVLIHGRPDPPPSVLSHSDLEKWSMESFQLVFISYFYNSKCHHCVLSSETTAEISVSHVVVKYPSLVVIPTLSKMYTYTCSYTGNSIKLSFSLYTPWSLTV